MESTDPLLVSHAERLSRLEGIAEQLNKMLETFGAEIRDQRAEIRDQRARARQAILYADNAYVYDDAFYGWFGCGGTDEIVTFFTTKEKKSARVLRKPGAFLIGSLESTGQMTVALVQMENISKSYGKVRALENVHLTVGEREIVGLLGDNGAGKSTLIKILSRGRLRQQLATIFIRGEKADIKSTCRRH